jgi:ABC-2 type transport system ATP-binding protein
MEQENTMNTAGDGVNSGTLRRERSAAIEVSGLRKSYEQVPVLQDVRFRVDTGTIFALLGANGSGKTTTINILTTLIKADGGTATVCGVDVARHPDKVREHISLTGQFAAVDDLLSARENLQLMCALRHVDGAARIVADLLAQFTLNDAADRRVATFSGGMRRRLDLAMSLIGQPSLIFLDEPTTGLDPESRNGMWQTIRTLVDSGTTVFLTTQYLEEADHLADQIAVLHQGRIAVSGAPGELKKLRPGGLIELVFHDDDQLIAATQVLDNQYAVTHNGALTVTLATDGSVTQLASIFDRLRDAQVEPAEFSQKKPTLDDVFLEITSHKS